MTSVISFLSGSTTLIDCSAALIFPYTTTFYDLVALACFPANRTTFSRVSSKSQKPLWSNEISFILLTRGKNKYQMMVAWFFNSVDIVSKFLGMNISYKLSMDWHHVLGWLLTLRQWSFSSVSFEAKYQIFKQICSLDNILLLLKWMNIPVFVYFIVNVSKLWNWFLLLSVSNQ